MTAETLFARLKLAPAAREEVIAASRLSSPAHARNCVEAALTGAALAWGMTLSDPEMTRATCAAMAHRHSLAAARLLWEEADPDEHDHARISALHADATLMPAAQAWVREREETGGDVSVRFLVDTYALAQGVSRTRLCGAWLMGVHFHAEHPQPGDPWRVRHERRVPLPAPLPPMLPWRG